MLVTKVFNSLTKSWYPKSTWVLSISLIKLSVKYELISLFSSIFIMASGRINGKHDWGSLAKTLRISSSLNSFKSLSFSHFLRPSSVRSFPRLRHNLSSFFLECASRSAIYSSFVLICYVSRALCSRTLERELTPAACLATLASQRPNTACILSKRPMYWFVLILNWSAKRSSIVSRVLKHSLMLWRVLPTWAKSEFNLLKL